MGYQNIPTDVQITAYRADLNREVEYERYFSKLMGSTNGHVIKEIDSLKADNQGDTVDHFFIAQLDPEEKPGKINEETLEGEEVTLEQFKDTISLTEYFQGIATSGKAARRKQTKYKLQPEIQLALRNWLAGKQDIVIRNSLMLNPSTYAYKTSAGKIAFTSNASTAKTGLDATNSKIDFSFIGKLSQFAAEGGKRDGSRQIYPLKPVKIEGEEVFILLLSKACYSDLIQSTTYKEYMIHAEKRGSDNPLFKKAKLTLTTSGPDVLIHTWERVVNYTDGGGGAVPYSHCMLLGESAGAFAMGDDPEPLTNRRDYDRIHGQAISHYFGAKKNVFNGEDIGCMTVYLATDNLNPVRT